MEPGDAVTTNRQPLASIETRERIIFFAFPSVSVLIYNMAVRTIYTMVQKEYIRIVSE
jgi:hypothetical protein